jgi:ectoine hydroxylase-related dioxygenase (phytanoyl-CoA dioxygenase family)
MRARPSDLALLCRSNLNRCPQIGPGSPAQPLHRDRWAFIEDQAFAGGELEIEVSSIWALSDFALECGPTRVVPGSHRWEGAGRARGRKPKAEEAAHAVMEKGSVVIYTGSVWHSGGQNASDRQRVGLNLDYNLAWLRQEENQYLACPPEIARELPRPMQDLIGYCQGGGTLGYYGDVLGPKKSFEGGRPINWASDWSGKEAADSAPSSTSKL